MSTSQTPYIMEKTVVKDISKLEKLSTYEKMYKNEIKEKNVIEAFGSVQAFSKDLQQLWVESLKETKSDTGNIESIEFYSSSVILKSKDGATYSSISEILIAAYIYNLYRYLTTYYDSIDSLIKRNNKIEDFQKMAEEAKAGKESKDKDDSEKLSGIIKAAYPTNQKNKDNKDNKEIQDKLLEFTYHYDDWNGGKVLSRKQDFWVSPIYKVLGLVQSRSGVHSYIPYFSDKVLYEKTKTECINVLKKYNNCRNIQSRSKEKITGKNIIYYGAPGTGKSYLINKKIKNICSDPSELVFRTTLFPDYSYTDFIGQILPQKNKDSIDYKFTPGIFTLALKKAVDCPDEHVFLVLEELSRANAAAVFGDIFQLLDRKDGTSEYSINNLDIAEYVYGNKNKKIIIPSNMSIYCSVNTSDQNVYPMDTAFKRRFEWRYVSTDSSLEADSNFMDNNNPKIDIGDGIKPTWKLLYQSLNKFIVVDLGLNEDKQIGPYFIRFEKNDEASAHKLVQDKLLQYLWNDIDYAAIAIHSTSTNLFLGKDKIPSFSSLYTKFSKKEKIFSPQFVEYIKSKL